MGASRWQSKAAKQRTLQIIDMDMATEVATDSGRKDIAAAIETVTFSVISQCADILKSYIQSEASALPSGDVRFPVAVTYAAKQIRMILAWLEIASTKAVTAESDRVDYLKNTISFMTTSGSLGIPAEASFLSAAIDALVVSPLDADFASFQKAIRQLQRVIQAVFGKGARGAAEEELSKYRERYRD